MTSRLIPLGLWLAAIQLVIAACDSSASQDSAEHDAATATDASTDEDAGVRTGDGGAALEPVVDGDAGPPAMATAEDFLGDWLATLLIPGSRTLEVGLTIEEGSAGAFVVTLDIPEQGALAIPGRDAKIEGDRMRVAFPLIGAFLDLAREGEQLVGLMTQGATLPITFEPTVFEQFPRPQEDALVRDYVIREVTFPGGAEGVTLAGELTVPRGAGPFPAALLVAGSDAENRDMELLSHKSFLVLSDHLTQAGIATLRYDNRGVGESSGELDGATTADLALDAAAAFAYLRAQVEVDPARSGLVGHTEGGLIATIGSADAAFLVLLASPTQPAAEVLMRRSRDVGRTLGTSEPVLDMQGMLQAELFEAVRAADSSEAAHSAAVMVLVNAGLSITQAVQEADNLTRPWFLWILDYDPLPALRAFEQPLLGLFGDRDLIVAADANAPDLMDALVHPDSSVRVLPDLNHLFQPTVLGGPGEYALIETTFDVGAMEVIAEWIGAVTAE